MKRFFASLLFTTICLILPLRRAAAAEKSPDVVTVLEVKTTKGEATGTMSFVVKVGYTLATTPQGKVMLGFALDQEKSFRMISNASVAAGRGEVELKADYVVPPGRKVVVYVNLSEDPHPKSWRPLASARKEITP